MNVEDSLKAELKELLSRYNASIGCNIDGDCHGLSFSMYFDIVIDGKCKEFHLCNDNEVSQFDIKL